MREIKRYITMTVLIIITGIGAAFSLKAAAGVGAWDAMNQTLSNMTGMKVGTMGMIINISCVAGQLVVMGRKFRFRQLLQIPVSIVLGVVVNFVLYNLLGNVSFDSYFIRMAVLISAYTVISAAVGAIMKLDAVTFALEGLCMAVSEKTGMQFSKLRQLVDFACIVIVLVLAFAIKTPLTVREGTIIGMFMFGPLMGFFMKKAEPVFNKLDLAPTA